jgi:short-subunit dehydrogenase
MRDQIPADGAAAMSDDPFALRYGPWAVIAGGSEGIGAAFADRLAAAGVNLLLIARKPEPLEAVAGEVRDRHGVEVRTLSLDLTAAEAAERIAAAASGCEVGMLIYNAGADSRFAAFLERPLEESERMVMLNVMTPMRLIRHFAPAMTARRRGGVIVCSSLAGLAGTPGNGVYSAAKAFENTFCEVLWAELGRQGVEVLACIVPLTRTPAMERLGLNFDGPLLKAADPFDIADEALGALGQGPALHAGGQHERAMLVRAMPRDEAVRAMSKTTDSTH